MFGFNRLYVRSVAVYLLLLTLHNYANYCPWLASKMREYVENAGVQTLVRKCWCGGT